MDTNGSVKALKGAIISSSTVHIPQKPKDLKRFASICVFRRKQAFCGSGWSFDRSKPLSRIGASDGHPVVDTQTAGFYSLQT